LPGTEVHQVGPHAGSVIVEEGDVSLGRTHAVPTGEDVVAAAPDSEQVVEPYSQALHQGEEGLEREATVPRLGLRDGTGRHAGQAGEVGLAQPALLTDPAQTGAESAKGLLLLEGR
jgi:hypothetical protein